MGEHTGWGTYAITVPATVSGAPSTILRSPCRLKGWSLAATGQAASEADGSVTSPAAAAVITATASLPAGDYLVEWTVELEGTLGAAVDNDNFRLVANAATQAASVNPGVAGTYPQQSQTVRLTAAGTISITSGILATVGAVYRAQIVATPSAPAAALILDGAQVLGTMGAQFGFSDTEFLDEEGIYVSTSVIVQVQQGTVSGCIYVKDYIPESEL
jgi:hypothetical protein